MSLADWITGKAGSVAKVASVAVASPQAMTSIDSESNTGSVATVATVAVAKPQTPTSIDAESPADHRLTPEIIKKNIFATATDATFATQHTTSLPPELIEAASRVCREIHKDPPEAVAAMIEDLSHCPPASWPALVDHFTRQLPDLPADPAPAVVIATCGACRHGTPSQHHAAIVCCGLGIPSGLPIAGRWSTDRHACPEFTDRHTGRKPAPIKTEPRPTPPRPTRTETPDDPFAFMET